MTCVLYNKVGACVIHPYLVLALPVLDTTNLMHQHMTERIEGVHSTQSALVERREFRPCLRGEHTAHTHRLTPPIHHVLASNTIQTNTNHTALAAKPTANKHTPTKQPCAQVKGQGGWAWWRLTFVTMLAIVVFRRNPVSDPSFRRVYKAFLLVRMDMATTLDTQPAGADGKHALQCGFTFW